MKRRFPVELAEKASTANRKRLIVQALRNALMKLSAGVFAALQSSASFCIFNAAYDRLPSETATKPAPPFTLARGKGKTKQAACGSPPPPQVDV
jgi:hypothetical protein